MARDWSRLCKVFLQHLARIAREAVGPDSPELESVRPLSPILGHIRILIAPDRQGEEDDILARLRRGERVHHFETARDVPLRTSSAS